MHLTYIHVVDILVHSYLVLSSVLSYEYTTVYPFAI